jgi:hypothetical protein
VLSRCLYQEVAAYAGTCALCVLHLRCWQLAGWLTGWRALAGGCLRTQRLCSAESLVLSLSFPWLLFWRADLSFCEQLLRTLPEDAHLRTASEWIRRSQRPSRITFANGDFSGNAWAPQQRGITVHGVQPDLLSSDLNLED